MKPKIKSAEHLDETEINELTEGWKVESWSVAKVAKALHFGIKSGSADKVRTST